MKVRPIELDRLPRAAPTSTAIADRLAAGNPAVLGKVVNLRMLPFGPVSLKCVDVVEPVEPDDGDVIWAISRPHDPRWGYLLVNQTTALRMVAGVLGVPPARGSRMLGAYERGIATASIAGALRATGSDIDVLLGPRAWRGHGLARLVIEMNHGGLPERMRVDAPSDWLLPTPDIDAWLAEATGRGLEISLRIDLARTTLPASDWSSARADDAVVFDAEPSLDNSGDWRAQIACGLFAAEVLLAPDGSARMVTAFENRGTAIARSAVDIALRKEKEDMSADKSQTVSLTMLAAAPIEVVAEIGRIVMRADEVTALRPGSVLTLGTLRPNTVDLRVGDRSWAQGELVDVDGQLGVRLTALSAAR
jgi:type III secretion system YscQ/HrcQ family protein